MSDPSESVPDRAALDALFEKLYFELKRRASRFLRGSRFPTLQTTGLVHEAWTRILGTECTEQIDEGQFMALASRAMRWVLVDHVRRARSEKRGGPDAERTPLDDVAREFQVSAIDLVALNVALEELREADPFCASIVDLRFFGGLNLPEIAKLVRSSLRTVEREWVAARQWLHRKIA